MLQFAAAHFSYLRFCLEMSSHSVLTASGTDKTLCKQVDCEQSSPKSDEGDSYLRLQPLIVNKIELHSGNENEYGGIVFVFLFFFIRCCL